MKALIIGFILFLLSDIALSSAFEESCNIHGRMAEARIYSADQAVDVNGEISLVIYDDNGDEIERHVKTVSDYIAPNSSKTIFELPVQNGAADCRIFHDNALREIVEDEEPTKEVIHHYYHYNPSPVSVGLVWHISNGQPNHRHYMHHHMEDRRVFIHRSSFGPRRVHYRHVTVVKPRHFWKISARM